MLLLIEKNLYKDKTKIENTKSLTFRYTVGNYINADIVYELYLINNSYIYYERMILWIKNYLKYFKIK